MTTYALTGVDDTGSTDVTSGILAFIATAADGASSGSRNTILFGSNKTYRCDGILEVVSRNNLIIDMNGSTVETDIVGLPVRTRSHWRFTTCSSIRITNGAIRGPNVNAGLGDAAYVGAYEAQHGVEVLSGADITIDNLEISKVYGDWIYLGVHNNTDYTDGVLVEDCNLIDNGRQGFGLAGAKNVEIRNNTTHECRRSLIDLEPNSFDFGCLDIWVHDNTFGEQRLSWLASKGYPGPVHNILFEDNTCESSLVTEVNPTGYGLRDNWIIRRNTSTTVGFGSNGPNAMIKFFKTTNVIIEDNECPFDRPMYFAKLYDCTDFSVTGNTGVNLVGQYTVQDQPSLGTDPPAAGDPPYTLPAVAGTATYASLSGLTKNIPVPAAAEVGDLMMVWIAHHYAGVGSATDFSEFDFGPAIEEEWSVIHGAIQGGNCCNYICTRVLEEDFPATFPFVMPTADSTHRTAAVTAVVRGFADAVADDVQSSASVNTNTSAVTVPTPTTLVANSLVMLFGFQRGGNSIFVPIDEDITIAAQVRSSAAAGASLFVAEHHFEGIGQGRQRLFNTNVVDRTMGVSVVYHGFATDETPVWSVNGVVVGEERRLFRVAV